MDEHVRDARLSPRGRILRHRSGRRIKEENRAMTTLLDAEASVRFLRREVGLTEVDLADGTGASTRTVRRWIASTRPQPRYAKRIALAHGAACIEENHDWRRLT